MRLTQSELKAFAAGLERGKHECREALRKELEPALKSMRDRMDVLQTLADQGLGSEGYSYAEGYAFLDRKREIEKCIETLEAVFNPPAAVPSHPEVRMMTFKEQEPYGSGS